MADGFVSRSRTILVFSAITLCAGCLWGLYALRALNSEKMTRLATGDSAAEPKVTPLRSTRPIPEIIEKIEAENTSVPSLELIPDRAVEEAALSMVRANAPAGRGHATEITLPARGAMSQVVRENARPIGDLLGEARSALARGDLVYARTTLSSSLGGGLPTTEEDWARGELSRLADVLLFSRATNLNDPLVAVHTIAAGDTLHALAAKHKITDDLLARVNRITEPNKLTVGQNIKLIHGPFRAVIEKSRHRLDVYLGDVFIHSFLCGLGSNGNTPAGEWIVNNKLANPDWTDPTNNRHYLADDPDNPIGEHWIGLHGVSGEAVGKVGFGIHGTIDPASIGQNRSMGCIRMRAEDVKLVYQLLVLNHSRVTIRP